MTVTRECQSKNNAHIYRYTLFDWDNIFGSYMLGIGDSHSAKAAAYSSLIQIVKAKTTAGFVPNANTITDRSEPPIGSKVLLELFKRHGDRWIVELLFDDLLDWSNWFLHARRLKPLGMIALGSVAGMDMARLESGCDDSPMYGIKLSRPVLAAINVLWSIVDQSSLYP